MRQGLMDDAGYEFECGYQCKKCDTKNCDLRTDEYDEDLAMFEYKNGCRTCRNRYECKKRKEPYCK